MAKVAKADPACGDILYGEQSTLVALDNGYADQKVCFWVADGSGGRRIEEMLLPSRARLGIDKLTMSGKRKGVYHVNGDTWSVGPEISQPERVTGKRYAHSDLNSVLVAHSLIETGFAGRDVVLSSGIPYSHFFQGAEINREFLENVRQSIAAEVLPEGGIHPARIIDHKIYPESVGSAIDWLVSDTGVLRNSDEVELGIAICDIGGNTLDVCVVDASLSIDHRRSGSVDQMGVLNIRRELGLLIEERFKVEKLRDSQLERALRRGQCKIAGVDQDVMALVSQARRETGKRVINYVIDMVGDGSDLDRVIFVGGGAQVLEAVLRQYPNAHVPNSPQFANARGFLKNLEFVAELGSWRK